MKTVDADLLKAASSGDLGAVSAALEGGANVNAKDEYNNTSLNWAALFGHLDALLSYCQGRVVKAGTRSTRK